jgi:hypothetical protein
MLRQLLHISWTAIAMLLATAAAAQTTSKEQTALLVLDDVNGMCTPTKPNVVVSKSLHPMGLKWEVDNRCDVDEDVEVFGFTAVQVGDCQAPRDSLPFKEGRLTERGIKKKEKKSFARNFTLRGPEGCWAYKVKVGKQEFDPQIKVER